MGAAKILGGLAFLAIGIVLLILAFVPIPGFESISITGRIISFISVIGTVFSTLDFTSMFGPIGYLSIAGIIPLVGYQYCKAGIKSMRYDKAKKKYIYTETKIGLMITGFILICVAAVIILLILLGQLEPEFQFLIGLVPTGPWFSYPYLLPQLLIPMVLTMLIIFFVYWIGSKIMKSGVKKEVISP